MQESKSLISNQIFHANVCATKTTNLQEKEYVKG